MTAIQQRQLLFLTQQDPSLIQARLLLLAIAAPVMVGLANEKIKEEVIEGDVDSENSRRLASEIIKASIGVDEQIRLMQADPGVNALPLVWNLAIMVASLNTDTPLQELVPNPEELQTYQLALLSGQDVSGPIVDAIEDIKKMAAQTWVALGRAMYGLGVDV